MKKIAYIGIGIALALSAFIPFFAFAQVPIAHRPFGGIVIGTAPCDEGLVVFVQTISGVHPFMWLWGELPYLMHTPPHTGQYLLGMAGPVSFCTLDGFPFSFGETILFHGSSL